MRRSMTEIAKAVERIRKFFKSHPDVTLGGFASLADLHRNTLYGLDEKSWNPTRVTLEKCLRTIEKMETEEAQEESKRTPKIGAEAPRAA